MAAKFNAVSNRLIVTLSFVIAFAILAFVVAFAMLPSFRKAIF